MTTALAVGVAPASALTRKQASKVARAALKPERAKGAAVVVFGLRAPIGARTTVADSSSSARPRAAGARAWLFWEDLAYGAKFEHPSRLVLVSDATGRVIRRTTMAGWPEIDGKPASFIKARGPDDRKLRVFSRFRREQPVALDARVQPPPAFPLARASFKPDMYKGECVVLAGDFGGFAFDFKRVDDYFRSRGATLRHATNADGTTHADSNDVNRLIAELAK